jgi:hypothetical protein
MRLEIELEHAIAKRWLTIGTIGFVLVILLAITI